MVKRHQAAPTYHLLGVPLRTGSLYPGSENDAQAYRDARIVQRLHAAGCPVIDEGDVAIPSYLPHHNAPPIKNWPGPRIAWECIGERIAPFLQQPGHVPLLIGADCSVVVGAPPRRSCAPTERTCTSSTSMATSTASRHSPIAA